MPNELKSRYCFWRSRIAAVLVMFACVFPVLGDKPATPPKNEAEDPKSKNKSKPLPPLVTPAAQLAAAPASSVKPVDMKLLVITGDGTEPGFTTIRMFLDQIGIPYDAVIAMQQELPPLANSSNTQGFYQGIILATGNLGVCDQATPPKCASALSAAGWAALDDYTRLFRVRVVSYYTFPEPRYGLAGLGMPIETTDAAPATLSFAPGAAAVFPDLNASARVKVTNAWMYVAIPAPAAGETTVPLLTTQGGTVAAIHRKLDGREYMALTMDNNYFLMHSLTLKYGIINWVTKGVYLGSRKVYFTPQIDDLFIPSDLYDPRYEDCIPSAFVRDPSSQGVCPTQLRIEGPDLQRAEDFQNSLRARPQFADFRIYMAYNGYGTTPDGGAPPIDSLVAYADNSQGNGGKGKKGNKKASPFGWVSHTYDHENLDCFRPVGGVCVPASYDQSTMEIVNNVKVAEELNLTLDATAMVTPEISGLNNPQFISAAVAQGIRYLVADTSRLEMEMKMPPVNTGIRSPHNSSILLIPRRPTNIFYNASSGLEGTAGSEPDEYNYFYAPGGLAPAFPVKQTYTDVIERESDNLLRYLLAYSPYPVMFHETNLWRYHGSQSLFSDLVSATFNKFAGISTLPVLSPTQTQIGQLLESRMEYNASGVKATLTPGLSITFTSLTNARIPVTGICATKCETYGSQRISYIDVRAGKPVTLFPQF